MPTEERIIIRHISKPSKEGIDEFTSWFLQSFDLTSTDRGPRAHAV